LIEELADITFIESKSIPAGYGFGMRLKLLPVTPIETLPVVIVPVIRRVAALLAVVAVLSTERSPLTKRKYAGFAVIRLVVLGVCAASELKLSPE
jgi:hypothetical protein